MSQEVGTFAVEKIVADPIYLHWTDELCIDLEEGGYPLFMYYKLIASFHKMYFSLPQLFVI